jgi:hypothetical protein
MDEPLDLDTLLSEFGEEKEAWVLQDRESGLYVTIPHPKYPGRSLIHFFLSRENAQDVLMELLDENERLRDKEIFPVAVRLLQAARGIAAGSGKAGNADSFVVHSANEVYTFLRDRA